MSAISPRISATGLPALSGSCPTARRLQQLAPADLHVLTFLREVIFFRSAHNNHLEHCTLAHGRDAGGLDGNGGEETEQTISESRRQKTSGIYARSDVGSRQ